MKRDRTPWFPSRGNPARRGVYERDFGTIGIRFAYWTGTHWGGFAIKYTHAVHNRRFKTGHPEFRRAELIKAAA